MTLSTQEAADHLGLSVSLLEKLRVRGTGPKYLKLGRAVRYRKEALESWLDAHERLSTTGA